MKVPSTGVEGYGTDSASKDNSNPRFLSWRWFKCLFSAVNVAKYDTRNWGVFHFSSLLTDLKWFFILGGGKLVSLAWSKLPLVFVETCKAIWIKVAAFATALWNATIGAFSN